MKTWRSEMRRYSKFVVVAGAVVALAAPSAAMAGGNSDNAHNCQQNWQNLVRTDGTSFANQDACVSYAAHGGVLNPKPPASTDPISTPGSENFSSYDAGSQPATFLGGTIDPSSYAPGNPIPNGGWGGSILVAGPYFNGFANDTHFLFTGVGQNSAKLTFTNPVKSVQLQAENDKTGITTNLTLTGYDASGNVVAHDTESDVATGAESVTLNITSQSSNIKYFTIATDDPNVYGLGFTNLVWS
jgi:hypothetical protein